MDKTETFRSGFLNGMVFTTVLMTVASFIATKIIAKGGR